MRDRFVAGVGANVDLIKSSGGVFEISLNGKLRFSKKQLDRFPTDAELDTLMAS